MSIPRKDIERVCNRVERLMSARRNKLAVPPVTPQYIHSLMFTPAETAAIEVLCQRYSRMFHYSNSFEVSIPCIKGVYVLPINPEDYVEYDTRVLSLRGRIALLHTQIFRTPIDLPAEISYSMEQYVGKFVLANEELKFCLGTVEEALSYVKTFNQLRTIWPFLARFMVSDGLQLQPQRRKSYPSSTNALGTWLTVDNQRLTRSIAYCDQLLAEALMLVDESEIEETHERMIVDRGIIEPKYSIKPTG